MRVVLLVSLIILSTPAVADEMTPVGCNAISESAVLAAEALDNIQSRLAGFALHDAIPYMPEPAKAAATTVEDKEADAGVAISDYAKALRDFATAIKACGN